MSARIGIIGGGISGLASAYRLAERGHQVTVLESSDSLGGLGTFFELDGRKIDCFYHCLMPSDEYLLSLVDDLRLTKRLYWKNTLMGMVHRGHHYPFNTAIDLLRFMPLSLCERVRLGSISLLLRHLGKDEDLDGLPIEEWLTQLCGKPLWEKFWAPMFAAKFGVGAATLPSLYLKKRLGRESNVATRGYIDGGLYGLILSLEMAIRECDGTIETNCSVNGLSQTNGMVTVSTDKSGEMDFDHVVSTIPLSLLASIGDELDGIQHLPKLSYQGVVNMVLLLDRQLDSYYWTPTLHSDTGFDGVVESSALIEREHYGGHHLAYVMKYTHRESELYGTPDADIARRWTADFLRVYESRGITPKNVKGCFVFKAPFVEPIYPLNYTKLRPRTRLGRSSVYLATTAQVYPYITSWNSSIGVAENTVAALLRQIETDSH